MTITSNTSLYPGFYMIPLATDKESNVEPKPLQDNQDSLSLEATSTQETETPSTSLINSDNVAVKSKSSEADKAQGPQLRNSFFLTLLNLYRGKKSAANQANNQETITLAAAELENDQTRVQHPTISKIKECFGEAQKIGAKQLNVIEKILNENPEAVPKIDQFFSNFQTSREQILEILGRDDGILPELEDPLIMENGMILYELMQLLPHDTEEEAAASNQLLRLLRATLDQLTCNMQIHTDYFNSGIEEKIEHCIGGGFDRTIQNYECLKQELADLQKLTADNPETLDKKQKKRLAKLSELVESRYAPRDNCQGIENRCLWEDVVKNEAGGFVSGFRRISFRSKEGIERTADIPLDLSSLGNLNREQSKKVFRFLLEFEQKVYTAAERNLIQHRLLKEALIDLSKMIQDQLVMGVDFNDIRVFSDKQTELIARLQQVPQSPLPKECQELLDELNFLSNKQKDQLIGIAAEFSYRMNRSTQLTYLNLVTH